MNQRKVLHSPLRLGFCTGWLLLFSGCMQLDTHILINEDGSATITEKFRLSRRILDMEGGGMGGQSIASHLEKPAVEKRMALMGQGISLVSHKIQDASKGARESVAVFLIPDINNLEYVSPYLGHGDYADNNTVKCKFEPIYKSDKKGRKRAGELMVRFQLKKRPAKKKRPKKGEKPPPDPTPEELQLIRNVRPVFRDIMRGFKLRLTLEAYSKIRGAGIRYRDYKSGTNRLDLIHFTDMDLDRWGGKFLDNEEVLLDLIREKYGSKNVLFNVGDFPNNHTVPVYIASKHVHRPQPHGGAGILFRPSRALFDRYFKGKMIVLYTDRPPRKARLASYKEIGWHPKPGNKKK